MSEEQNTSRRIGYYLYLLGAATVISFWALNYSFNMLNEKAAMLRQDTREIKARDEGYFQGRKDEREFQDRLRQGKLEKEIISDKETPAQ